MRQASMPGVAVTGRNELTCRYWKSYAGECMWYSSFFFQPCYDYSVFLSTDMTYHNVCIWDFC